jgi:DNA uptake protein ComE-like DNA-binding protein
LARIYGLEPSVFNTLLPFIEIGSKDKREERNSPVEMAEGKAVLTDSPGAMADETAVLTDSFQPVQTMPLAGFELNAADTSTLQLLKGVGPVTAMRIVRYGNQLGGYHAVSQLTEISGIYPTVLASLQKSLTVDASLIRKINVNKASLERLRAHPYLDFYQAKTIIGLRTARKGIDNLSELSEFKEFTKEDLERLKWYLAF